MHVKLQGQYINAALFSLKSCSKGYYYCAKLNPLQINHSSSGSVESVVECRVGTELRHSYTIAWVNAFRPECLNIVELLTAKTNTWLYVIGIIYTSGSMLSTVVSLAMADLVQWLTLHFGMNGGDKLQLLQGLIFLGFTLSILIGLV